MHASNRTIKERLHLSLLIPVTLLYVLYGALSFHYLTLVPLLNEMVTIIQDKHR